MSLINKALRNKKLLFLILVALVVASSGGSLLSIGIITGYQGLQAEFYGVYFKDFLYTQDHLHNPNYRLPETNEIATVSAFSTFDHLNFDPDGSAEYMPNLKMSMQPITVDSDWPPKTYGPWQIKIGEGVQEDGKIYDVYKEYEILEYRCSWSVNMWCDGPGDEAHEDEDHWYHDAEVWVRLTPMSFVYFEDNPDEVYFAPSYIGLTDITWRSGETNPRDGPVDNEMAGLVDIYPEATGEVMGIFYTCGGLDTDVYSTVLSYQGKTLDPTIFRDRYWIRFGAERFGAKSWWGWPDFWNHFWKYPSANMQFQINIFVVGEWTVKLETGEVPELIPRIPYWVYQSWQWILNDLLQNFLTSPFTYVWLIAVVVILYFVSKTVLKVYSGGKT